MSRQKKIKSMNLSEHNKNFYYEDASEAEVYHEVVEIEDDFERGLSPEDNELLEEILEKHAIDLKFGASYDIPIEINPQVIYFIRYFQTRGRRHFEKWLERSKFYIPYIRSVLKENNMPEDLVFVSMIESGFSPRAYSSAGAVGPWQFMKRTGTHYGLKINWWLDERRNLEKSTLSAIKYFKFLHEKFNDWYLAIAAYNAGEGKIARAIQMYNSKNYWDLCKYRYIRSETKNYVPKMIAAALIVKNLKEYGFADIEYDQTFPKYQTINIEKQTDLFKVAQFTGTTYKELKELNPELTRWSTPPDTKNYSLILPEKIDEDQISTLLTKLKKDNTTFKRHIVKYGENLWKIAKLYRTSVEQIKNMNKLANNSIRIGQSLGIPVSNLQRYPSAEQNPETAISKKNAFTSDENTLETFPYSVKKGDSIWSIASKFKVSPAYLKKYNKGLARRNSKLLSGETLNIPKIQNERSIETLPVESTNNTLTHKVSIGETLYSIARQYTTTIDAIIGLNNINHQTIIKPGDLIRIR